MIISIVGSVVECSPATRAARVRFPDDARLFVNPKSIQNTWQSPKKQVLYYEYFCFFKLPPSCRQFSKMPFNSITLFRVNGSKKYFCQKVLGGAGYRSRYLSHAKRALYHLSYAPGCMNFTVSARLANPGPNAMMGVGSSLGDP